jgi:rubrerythrin
MLASKRRKTFLIHHNQDNNMVSEKQHEGGHLYICDVCGFGYRKKEQASNCEEFCASTNSCSIAITKDAIYFPKHK